MCTFLNFYIRSAILLETYMVSIERVKEYSELEMEVTCEISVSLQGYLFIVMNKIKSGTLNDC